MLEFNMHWSLSTYWFSNKSSSQGEQLWRFVILFAICPLKIFQIQLFLLKLSANCIENQKPEKTVFLSSQPKKDTCTQRHLYGWMTDKMTRWPDVITARWKDRSQSRCHCQVSHWHTTLSHYIVTLWQYIVTVYCHSVTALCHSVTVQCHTSTPSHYIADLETAGV